MIADLAASESLYIIQIHCTQSLAEWQLGLPENGNAMISRPDDLVCASALAGRDRSNTRHEVVVFLTE